MLIGTLGAPPNCSSGRPTRRADKACRRSVPLGTPKTGRSTPALRRVHQKARAPRMRKFPVLDAVPVVVRDHGGQIHAVALQLLVAPARRAAVAGVAGPLAHPWLSLRPSRQSVNIQWSMANVRPPTSADVRQSCARPPLGGAQWNGWSPVE